MRVGRRFAQLTTDDFSGFFVFKNKPPTTSTKGAFGAVISVFTFEFIAISYNAHIPRLGRSKEFKESRSEERSVLCT